MSDAPHEESDQEPGRVLAVHLGHSANCSSVGSVIDFLFLSSVVGGALISAIVLLVRQPEKKDGDER